MKVVWLIIGMALVTYLPRFLPLVALSNRPLHPFLKRFLLYIPYTALGALIIPGSLQATPDKPLASLAGIGAAVVCAWYRGGLVLSVLASVLGTFLILYFFGK